MRVRRVVTGHDTDGRPMIASDGAIPRSHEYASIPGMVERLAWATEARAAIATEGADPTAEVTSYVPSPGSTRLIVLTLPPDAVFTAPGFDAAAAAAELAEASPGIAQCFEPDVPGMHRTSSVDYAFVLDGEIWLDLDRGNETRLRQGDHVVQNGTRHAWRNRSDAPATLGFVLIGAVTSGDPQGT